LQRPLVLGDIKHMLLGHWGTGARRRGRISSTCTLRRSG
jgi:hypothetical protein